MRKLFISAAIMVCSMTFAQADDTNPQQCWIPTSGLPTQLGMAGCQNDNKDAWHAKAQQLRSSSKLCEDAAVRAKVAGRAQGIDTTSTILALDVIVKSLNQGANACQTVSNGDATKHQKSKCDLYYQALYTSTTTWTEPTEAQIKANITTYETPHLNKCAQRY